MNKSVKIGTALAFLASSVMLSSCGDESSSPVDSRTVDTADSVESYDDLPNCSSNREGAAVAVKDDGVSYVCQGGKWFEAAAIYKNEDDLPVCSQKREGFVAYINESEKFVTCTDASWITGTPKEGNSGIQQKSSSSSVKSESGSKKAESSSSTKSSSSVKSENVAKSSSAKASNSSASKVKQVEFEDGILWKPSYGKRVRTFAGDADEYTFLSDSTGTGWWIANGDKDNYGKSTVTNTFGESYATFKHNLVYQNWNNESGVNKPSPAPYAQSGFLFGKKGAWFQDVSAYKGLCFVYTSDKEFRIELQSRGKSDSYEDDDYWDVWAPPSSSKKTVNLKFTNLPKAWWRSENVASLAKALTEMRALAIQSPYMDRVHCYEEDVTDCNDVTYMNNIKLYMIGEYGKCPDYDSYELGTKQVEFEDGVLWKPSYGYDKVRTFFGDVDEYNFKSSAEIGDNSGWWYTYSDTSGADKGKSTAVLANGDGLLKANLKLVYQWKKNAEGKMTPAPYPYAAFGFDWASSGNPGVANLNDLGSGLCLTYTATRNVDLIIHSYREEDEFDFILTAATSKKTVNIKFSDFEECSWCENKHSMSNALKRIQNLHFLFGNGQVGDDLVWCTEENAADCGTQTYTNEIKIYKLGKYGACN